MTLEERRQEMIRQLNEMKADFNRMNEECAEAEAQIRDLRTLNDHHLAKIAALEAEVEALGKEH